MRCVVIMGVSGSGKSSLGAALTARGIARFVDGDDLHPPANIEKMSAGIPLTDSDRRPWLLLVADTLRASRGPIAIACSALRRQYRDLIRERARQPVFFIFLDADPQTLARRLSERRDHFLPLQLLKSQLETLEPLQDDEAGVRLSMDQSLPEVVDEAVAALEKVGIKPPST